MKKLQARLLPLRLLSMKRLQTDFLAITQPDPLASAPGVSSLLPRSSTSRGLRALPHVPCPRSAAAFAEVSDCHSEPRGVWAAVSPNLCQSGRLIVPARGAATIRIRLRLSRGTPEGSQGSGVCGRSSPAGRAVSISRDQPVAVGGRSKCIAL